MALECCHLREDREVPHTWSERLKHLFLQAMERESAGGKRLVKCLESSEGYCFKSTHRFSGLFIKEGDKFVARIV